MLELQEESGWDERGVVFVCTEDISPVANVLVEGVGDKLIGDEEGTRICVW